MRIDNNTINEIRENIDIVDVISNYLPLTSKGKNYFGVCPFHDDHSPSMSVSKERQIYTCFSCGATGNVFKFIQDYENISFIEAVKKCADMVGISLDIGKITTKNKHQDLYDIYELSFKFYQNNINTELGKKAKEYLHNRSLDDVTIKEFGIGLSLNEKDVLTKLLKSKKYSDDILIKSGKDDLCKKCPNDGSGTAICKDDSVNQLDEKVKFLIGVETGKTYKFSEIMKRMKWVMTPEVHKDLCSDCCWWRKGLCRDTFAENSTSPLLSVTSKGKINTNGLKYVPPTEKAA
mgnify:CR=1 FL=1